MATKYLYGASVQGIQSFIFETNKLAEIVGASELVENICTNLFKKECPNFDEKRLIIGAAGNIKYVFEIEKECKDLVLNFPKTAMMYALGITISQAVVSYEDGTLQNALDTLEQKLKTQRNKVVMPTEIGFMGLERDRRTGGVGFEEVEKRKEKERNENDKKEIISESTSKKRAIVKDDKNNKTKDSADKDSNETLFAKISGEKRPKNSQLAFDIEDITKSGLNSWIAVIHADGNGLGNILQNKGAEMIKAGCFNTFSKAIEEATKSASQKAYFDVIPEIGFINKETGKEVKRYPIRPVVLGGDDLTVIIRADLALEFTEKFLTNFESETERIFKRDSLSQYVTKLTACAGIAFIKESYPLHYGLHLAEALCKDAKKMVKGTDKKEPIPSKYGDLPQSSLAFYKVQDSHIEELEDLKKRTLVADKSEINFYYGPYLLKPEGNFANVVELNALLGKIKTEAESKESKSKAVGKLRQIVSEIYKDKSTAQFMLDRMKEINPKFYSNLKLDNYIKEVKIKDNNDKEKIVKTSILNDLIQLHSFNYGNDEN